MESNLTALVIAKDCINTATQEGCPIYTQVVANMILKSLGINGTVHTFCKCKKDGYYNLSWVLENGEEYMNTYSEQELLDIMTENINAFLLETNKKNYERKVLI